MIAQIVIGSKAVFDLKLRDNQGDPVTLSDYASGKLRFRSCAGVVTEVSLAVPGAHPDAGIIPVEIASTVTLAADKGWRDADLLLIAASAANNRIIPLPNAFEILAPEVVVP